MKTFEPPESEKPKDTYEHQFNLDDIPEPQLTGHQWLQLGNELRCTSCSFNHGTYIDPGYQLYGMDDEGKPLLREIKVSD